VEDFQLRGPCIGSCVGWRDRLGATRQSPSTKTVRPPDIQVNGQFLPIDRTRRSGNRDCFDGNKGFAAST